MPLTPDERRNERLRLLANWFNTLGTAIVTAGTFVPLAQFVYGVLPPSTPAGLIYSSGVVCIVTGLLIHLLGQWILGGLR